MLTYLLEVQHSKVNGFIVCVAADPKLVLNFVYSKGRGSFSGSTFFAVYVLSIVFLYTRQVLLLGQSDGCADCVDVPLRPPFKVRPRFCVPGTAESRGSARADGRAFPSAIKYLFTLSILKVFSIPRYLDTDRILRVLAACGTKCFMMDFEGVVQLWCVVKPSSTFEALVWGSS